MTDRNAGRVARFVACPSARPAVFSIVVLFCGLPSALGQQSYDAAALARARASFVDRMVAGHDYERESLDSLLAAARIDEGILEAIARPAERVVPWYDYRQIFLTETRIVGGASFWRRHEQRIERIAARFGVAPEVILAIIGVESFYGERMGRYRVIDALSTLAFAYPPRSEFFTDELEAFLLLHREEEYSLSEVQGSYAGAMGAGQFIPSSYRAYAVDGDNDGRRDLWSNWDDILSSVANYLARHGWRNGEPVAVKALRADDYTGGEPSNRLELDRTVGDLRAAGYEFDVAMPSTAAAAAFSFESGPSATEYWIGLNNFWVITRYNRSTKYALAVHELSRAIRDEMTAVEVAQ